MSEMWRDVELHQISAYIIATGYDIITNPCIKELWIFIFKEITCKSKYADNLLKVKEIFVARGDWFLWNAPIAKISSITFDFTNTNYDSNIINWHVATEIWYNKEESTVNNEKREFSKILSDYMLYLLLNQHNVVSAVTGVAQTTSVDTLARFSFLFEGVPKDIKELCGRLYDIPQEDFLYNSGLGKGIGLAREMERLEEEKWEVMSGVWVEMLSYAAGHIKGEAHVQVLSNGGELLAFVWLLLAHFGCMYKPGWGPYYEDSSRGRDFENTLV